MNTDGAIAPANAYAACRLCGKECGSDRLVGMRGFCGESAELRIATASIHRGEEPPVTGKGGSGTVFVTGCTLRCSFCQNHQISQEGMGAVVDPPTFARICLELERRGAENVNIVTGSHAVPALIEGLVEARRAGLGIPALWNSSAYEKVEAIDAASAHIDVYLPDLKTLDKDMAARFFRAPDYPEVATAAILRMVRARPLRFEAARIGAEARGDDDEGTGLIVSGTIMRHLVMPGYLESTRKVIAWFAENLMGKALLSLMTQYTPVHASESAEIPERFVSPDEYGAVLEMLDEAGIEDGYYQELVVGDDWLPDFTRPNPFSSDLSQPVWHWREGFMR